MPESARSHHRMIRFQDINRRFCILGTPMSRRMPCLCALSTSSRVGEERHCIVQLLALKSNVLKALIATCSHKLKDRVSVQLTSCIVPTPFCIPNLVAAHITTATLTVNTRRTMTAQIETPTRQPWNTPGVEDFLLTGRLLSSSTKAAACEECSNGKVSD